MEVKFEHGVQGPTQVVNEKDLLERKFDMIYPRGDSPSEGDKFTLIYIGPDPVTKTPGGQSVKVSL